MVRQCQSQLQNEEYGIVYGKHRNWFILTIFSFQFLDPIVGEPLFVARAYHEDDLIPGKLVPSHGVTYVAYGGREHGHRNYEVLVGGRSRWVQTQRNQIPQNAIPGKQHTKSQQNKGEKLKALTFQVEELLTVKHCTLDVRNTEEL